MFQLTDFYTLFYFRFIANNEGGDTEFWSRSLGSTMHNQWAGLAFERVCLTHVNQIKAALSIGGVVSSEAAWYSAQNRKNSSTARGAQIDLLIDRNDGIIDLCEMKYYADEVSLDDEEETKIENRKLRLREETQTEKAVHAILVTTKGLKRNAHSDCIQSVVTMEYLFKE